MRSAEPLAADFAPAGLADWRRLVDAVLKGEPFESLQSSTPDGIVVEPLYAPAREAQPLPGRAPGARWAIVQRLDHPDPQAAAVQAGADLRGGADGLALVFAGAPSAHGFGLPVAAEALARVLDGMALEAVRLRIEPHPAAGRTAAWLRDLAGARGLDPARLDIGFGLDPVGSFARWGGLPFAWHDVARRLAEGGRGLAAAGFRGPLFEVDGRVFHDAGATDAQELGAVLASAVATLRALDRHGWDAAESLPCIGVTLAADAVPLETTAKLRAARLLVARLAEACGLAPVPCRLHAETSRRRMMRADPHTNILRAAIAAFAAGTAGADSLAVLPFTAALGLPDAAARRLARNTQAILMEEAHLHRLADPAAGSGAVEALTGALAEAAWGEFQAIERDGGIVACLEAGALQGRIGEARRALEAAVAGGAAPLVGATIYPNPQPAEVAVLEAQPWPEPEVAGAAVRCEALAPKALAPEALAWGSSGGRRDAAAAPKRRERENGRAA